MTLILDVLVIGIYAAVCVRALIWSQRWRMVRSVDLVTGMVFLFYALPLAYNWVMPPTRVWSSVSVELHVVYDLLLLATLLLVRVAARRREPFTASPGEIARQWGEPMQPSQRDHIMSRLGWLLLLAPPLAVLTLAPNPAAYLRFGVVELRDMRPGTLAFFAHSIIGIIVPLGVFGFFLVFSVNVRRYRRFWTPSTAIALLLALVAAYILGKRSVLFFLLTIILGLTWFEARLRLAWVLLLSGLFLVFSFTYLALGKGVEKDVGDFVRGDLARDYVLLGVLETSDWKSNSMLPYPGAGYLFQFVFPVPRSMWYDKPWPTSVYVTNGILGIKTKKDLGWGFGVGFQEEALANFGYAGYAVVCLLFGRLCRLVDRLIYERSSAFALCWVPITFGCVFALYVVFTVSVAAVALVLVISFLAWVAGAREGPQESPQEAPAPY